MADPDSVSENPENDYERSDISISAVGVVALFTVLWVALIPLVLSWGYSQVMHDTDKLPHVTPPAPQVQTNPNADLAAFRRQEEAWLTSYGWIDRDKGIVRIPIEAALAKIAHDGIPDWPGQAQAPAQGQAK